MLKMRIFKPGSTPFELTVENTDLNPAKIVEELRSAIKNGGDKEQWTWYCGNLSSGQHVIVPAEIFRTHIVIVESET